MKAESCRRRRRLLLVSPITKPHGYTPARARRGGEREREGPKRKRCDAALQQPKRKEVKAPPFLYIESGSSGAKIERHVTSKTSEISK